MIPCSTESEHHAATAAIRIRRVSPRYRDQIVFPSSRSEIDPKKVARTIGINRIIPESNRRGPRVQEVKAAIKGDIRPSLAYISSARRHLRASRPPKVAV